MYLINNKPAAYKTYKVINKLKITWENHQNKVFISLTSIIMKILFFFPIFDALCYFYIHPKFVDLIYMCI